jgi:hypothetical protein
MRYSTFKGGSMSGTRKCKQCKVVSIPSDMSFCSIECEAASAQEIAKTSKNKGLKYDGNKPDLSLIPKAALDSCAKAFMFGASKYERDNFREGMEWTRLTASCMRHVTAFQEGENLDPESGVHHLGHALACLSMLMYYVETQSGTDNRPVKGQLVKPKLIVLDKAPADILEYNGKPTTPNRAQTKE